MSNSNVPVARSSSHGSALDSSSQLSRFRQFISKFTRRGRMQHAALARKPWHPPALHPFTLCLAILISWSLIIALQILLHRSQRDNGVLFAPDINALPLSRTFLYQYFPTIVAVIFSIFWAWIDLEAKRLEPWFRLSSKEAEEKGVLGKDSLLLCYPFDFMPFVPIRAFREKQWTVFWASFALVLVTWGLVPTQAGIFSVRHITRTFSADFEQSTSYIPAEQQPNKLTVRFAQSTYGIVALNETLPAFMTRDYVLAPFKPSASGSLPAEGVGQGAANGNWTSQSTLYSLDLNCSPAIKNPEEPNALFSTYNSTTGCLFGTGGIALSGNKTQGTAGDDPLRPYKRFSALYAGYFDVNGFSMYRIDYCPPGRNHTFYAAFTQNKAKDTDPPNNVTSIFCEPSYYQQDVNATISTSTQAPIHVEPLGSKRELDNDIFNTTWLEEIMNGGQSDVQVRGDVLPDYQIPNFIEQILSTDLTLGTEAQPMMNLAVFAGGKPLEEYLDWRTLASSYEKAYRLLFTRAMVDVLDSGFATSMPGVGNTTMDTDALVLEPIFTYIVEGFLGIVSIAAMMLLYFSVRRTVVLRSNPSTIASLMSLVADNQALLTDFENVDCCTAEELQDAVKGERYKLVSEDNHFSIVKASPGASASGQASRQTSFGKAIDKPVRPKEFSLWMALPFVGVFIVLAVSLAVVFIKSRTNGLPLPSKNKIVQNILENYIPTAIATLIEPMWILINRLLCLLQPIEELQDCKAKAKESIELDYSSLPPQLVVFKALKARHFVLAAVCSMALLANLLAVAFAGLFFHDTVEILKPTNFQPPFDLKFVSINGSVGPVAARTMGSTVASGAYRGGNGIDQFLIAESNYTKDTPLPAWTDDKLFYVPFTASASAGDTGDDEYEAKTAAIGAELDCKELGPDTDYRFDVISGVDLNRRTIVNVPVRSGNVEVNCTTKNQVSIEAGPIRDPDSQSNAPLCVEDPAALELVLTLDAGNTNASQSEKEICWGTVVLGWFHAPEGSCKAFNESKPTANQSILLQCQPRLVQGHATVRVDVDGRLLNKVQGFELEQSIAGSSAGLNFSSNPINLVGQANQYLFQLAFAGWHNDSFASDFTNYFVRRESNSSQMIDPKMGLPTMEQIEAPLSNAYSRLFAIWLGANKEHLLLPRSSTSVGPVSGWRVTREERLFLSIPLFAIAEGILSTYAIVAIIVYLRRPGAYLPRLPTSIASMIGLFAASGAVQDMRGTYQFRTKERINHLEKLDLRYGYGSYVGIDGRVHFGIEKRPFVRPRRSKTWWQEKTQTFRRATTT